MTLFSQYDSTDVLCFIDGDSYEAVLSPEASGEATLNGDVICTGLATKQPKCSFDVRFDDTVDESETGEMLDVIEHELRYGFKDTVDRVFELIDNSDKPIETIKSLDEKDLKRMD